MPTTRRPSSLRLLLLLAPLVPTLVACQAEEGPVDDMLVEYDRFIEDQFLSLTAFHEANGLAPLDREEYDEYGDRGRGFRWAQGSPRRACLIDAGHGDKFRDHPVWERLIEVLTDEGEASLRWTLPRIKTADARLDLDNSRMDSASVGDPGFPWRNCGYLQ